ncbi:MAG: IS200/IS605 family transposase [Bacteroidales bacterium]
MIPVSIPISDLHGCGLISTSCSTWTEMYHLPAPDERLHFHFDRVCKDFGCRLIECDGEQDHVYLLVEPLPQTTPSRLVNSLKGVSSRMLRQEFPELQSYYWKGGLWSPSYFIASCGGAPLGILKEYIRNQ